MIIDNAEPALYALLITLGLWSALWLVLGVYKTFRETEKRYYWLTHVAWVIVNLFIVAVGYFAISSATLDTDFITLQRNIVAINAVLDFGYMAVAKYMQRSKRTAVCQAGRAIFIQGAFLFALDIVFALIFTLLLL